LISARTTWNGNREGVEPKRGAEQQGMPGRCAPQRIRQNRDHDHNPKMMVGCFMRKFSRQLAISNLGDTNKAVQMAWYRQ
jgi:hypothetical protein